MKEGINLDIEQSTVMLDRDIKKVNKILKQSIVDPKETSEKELGLLMAGYSLEEARKELAEVGETVE